MRDFFTSWLFLLFSFFIAAIPCGAQSLQEKLNAHKSSANVTAYLDEKKWNELFPNRHGIGKNAKDSRGDFYSFKSFTAAASLFPLFLTEGDKNTQKRELAAFLAHIAQETSGGWSTAPGGYFKWGLYYLEENPHGQNLDYADATNKDYPPVAGKQYYGRGPKQLSWNYNYGQFSEAWYGNKDSLLQRPEQLAGNAVLSFASSIWFWMTAQKPKPSCHDVMIGKWKPSAADSAKGRLPGFGTTLNIVNGGIECGKGVDQEQTTQRYQYYQFFCNYFHVSPGENIDCRDQRPFNN